jgi:D-alanyl-D-alanine carboxypeptidase
MRRQVQLTQRWIAFAALLSALLAIAASPAAAAPATWRKEVGKAVKGVMAQQPIPGAIVGIWRHGKRPYVKAFGVRNKVTRAKMRPHLHMRIGSETKTFTATAVLELVDKGKVGLDDPISKYVAGVPGGEGVTIRQLLEMRSGLPSYTTDDAWIQSFLNNPFQSWTAEQLLPYGYKHPPLFAPGSAYNYSNSNYLLLGLVVERVTGQPISSYVRRRVLKPAGLTESVFPTNAAFPRPYAQGYTVQTASGNEENATRWNPSWGGAAGALISTVDDLHKWARVVATGQLLSRRTQRQRTQFIPVAQLPPVGYGLGLINVNGWLGHNGSLPGFESVTLYLPSKRATLVILLNSDESPPQAELSTLVGQAITQVITPQNIYQFGGAIHKG